jgi:alpha-methylacyl-CoA racemase
MTGWGQTGPLAQTAGHDPNYIAITGALHVMGYADRPPSPPLNLLGDFAGGSLYLVMGVLAALLHARATGKGQVIDAAIVDGTASLMTMVYSMFGAGLWSDQRGTNLMDGSCPFGSVYSTSDGGYMAVCALEPRFYGELIRKLGFEMSDLPDRWDRKRWPELRARFAETFSKRTRAQWSALFELSDACVAPVLSVAEAPRHPHNVARETFVGNIPAPAPRFSATPTMRAAREPETAAAMLQRWGFDGVEV